MNRREFLGTTASAIALSPLHQWQPKAGKRMGVTAATYAIRRYRENESEKYPPFTNALQIIEHAHSLGAGGVQIGVRGWEKDFAGKVRDHREKLGLYLEGQISLPKEDADVERFEQEVKHAREAGATILRAVCLGGRRYETFDTLESFQQFKAESMAAMERAEPIMRRHRVQLAIENHKDWRIDEMIGIMKHLGSEWMGVTLDLGNNISLLENPMAVVEALAPYALTTHFKDMAVAAYEDGFLLSEVPLGTGMLDLKSMIAVCEKHNPDITFNLEMITRDPLKVPCMTDKFWQTFDQVNGHALAKTLRMVQHAPKRTLPQVSDKTPEAQLAIEDENNRRSFEYATSSLGLR